MGTSGEQLTIGVSDCTNTPVVGRPPKPKNLARSERFFLRLTHGEMAEVLEASRRLGEPVAQIFRKGAAHYIHVKGKDGSKQRRKRK